MSTVWNEYMKLPKGKGKVTLMTDITHEVICDNYGALVASFEFLTI